MGQRFSGNNGDGEKGKGVEERGNVSLCWAALRSERVPKSAFGPVALRKHTHCLPRSERASAGRKWGETETRERERERERERLRGKQPIRVTGVFHRVGLEKTWEVGKAEWGGKYTSSRRQLRQAESEWEREKRLTRSEWVNVRKRGRYCTLIDAQSAQIS